MTTAFDPQFQPKDPRRCRGDAAASRLWLPNVRRMRPNPLKADTSRRRWAATQSKNLGLISPNGIERRNRSDYAIVPQLPVRWAS
jgi:hypothetical protein